MKDYKVIDYETTGFKTYKGDKIFAFVLTDSEIRSEVYRLDNQDTSQNFKSNRILKNFFRNSEIIKVAHNAKFEMGFTAMYYGGTLPKSKWDDTIIIHQMLRNLWPNHKLEVLANKYFKEEYKEECERWKYYDKEVKKHMTMQKRLFNNYPNRVEKEILEPMYDAGIKPLVENRENYGLIPVKIMNGYQVSDGERGALLYEHLFPMLLRDKPMYQDYLNEMKLLFVAQKMEQRGMRVLKDNCENLILDLKRKCSGLEKQKIKLFGFDINLDSPKQLREHLFGGTFNFKPVILTDKNQPSASKEAIAELVKSNDHPVFTLIPKWRAYSRGLTAVKSYLELAGEDLIIHPNMNTNEAKTSRQSVSNPALQNVQKENSATSMYGIPARRCFGPRDGYVYFLPDHSGIEMRLIVTASGETYFIDRLNEDPDYDCHSDNAHIILGGLFNRIDNKSEKKLARDCVKNTSFAKAYGCYFKKYEKMLAKYLSHSEAVKSWDRFEKERPNIFHFTDNMMEKVKVDGFITSAFGRKLAADWENLYLCSAHRIQCDASGIMKRGQVAIDDYIRISWDGNHDLISPLLSVHDELIIETHKSILKGNRQQLLLNDLSDCMTNIPEINVPLRTEWKMTETNWSAAKPITFNTA